MNTRDYEESSSTPIWRWEGCDFQPYHFLGHRLRLPYSDLYTKDSIEDSSQSYKVKNINIIIPIASALSLSTDPLGKYIVKHLVISFNLYISLVRYVVLSPIYREQN